jgi:hypothetical protein
MNQGRFQATSITLVTTLLFVLFCSTAFASPTYEGCEDCHGGFRDSPYTSLTDGTNWGDDLMDAHAVFVGDECNACHKSGSRGEVYLNFSTDSSLSKSCVGCHGRDEDVNGFCTGLAGGMGGIEAQCGSGDGLRKIHEPVDGANCSSCHRNPTPVGEHIPPFNYGQSGVVIQDSCDGDGTESQFGATGLDNDGDGQRDGSDSDCNAPPTQPGELSASAVTTNSATVSWIASTDPDGDDITYQVEYSRNGQEDWIDGGSTASTSQPLAGLDPDQSYDVRVTPNDGAVDGPDRTALSLFQTEAENSPPGQPGALSASLVTTNSATVSWIASTDADDDPITYQVDYRHTGQIAWIDGGNTAATNQPLAGLDPNQSYDVRVTPNDSTVDGPDRTAANLFQTEAENSPPGQPGALSSSLVTINSATVSWGASTDVDDDPITYQVDYRRTGQVAWIDGGSTAATSQALSGLNSDQAYDVRVTPNDGTEDGPDRTEVNLFQTEVDADLIHRDGFEGN